MPACDGPKCAESVPWRITKAGLQIGDEKTFPFKLDDVHTQLVAELTAREASVARSVKKVDVPFKNLCKKCWMAQAKKWGDPKTYEAARAKTDATGVYMQVGAPDYLTDGQLDKEAILSCTVHEVMHFMSHKSEGVSDYNRVINTDWDEAIADILGYATYKRMYAGKLKAYKTPYNQYAKAIDVCSDNFAKTVGATKFIANASDIRSKLPKALKDVFDKPENQDKAKKAQIEAEAAPIITKVLWDLFSSWFFLGGAAKLPGAPGDLTARSFFSDNGIKVFVNTSKAFPGYDGNNTAHKI